MDWTALGALGTWAAVVAALAIALKDTLLRWKERSARHILTAANIFPEVAQTKNAFETLINETAPEALPEPSAQELRDACDRFLSVAENLGLQHLAGHADQVDALPEHILIPLVKAITVTRMLVHNGSIAQKIDWAETDDGLRYALHEWREQSQSVVGSLKWVEQGIERFMRTRRWSNPEDFGW
ncbi:hypothetical protein [Pseudoxanthomonas kalamensis]|uniref:hypothetical protein n=1 Tax=Pseudoxanthomonas kalamensis TaxID=289483 RepID=UPI0013918A83|nr:hypothetical protein [Pseudoxanthomonas kalamensis]